MEKVQKDKGLKETIWTIIDQISRADPMHAVAVPPDSIHRPDQNLVFPEPRRTPWEDKMISAP